MEISEKAIKELRDILTVDIGDAVNELSDQDLNNFGMFLLTVGVNSLKVRARQINKESYGE